MVCEPNMVPNTNEEQTDFQQQRILSLALISCEFTPAFETVLMSFFCTKLIGFSKKKQHFCFAGAF